MRCFLGAFGDAGHALPMIALGAELTARGHAVTLETGRRWQADATGLGMRFLAAPEDPWRDARGRATSANEAIAAAVAATRPALAAAAPDVVVHDVVSLAPALCGELERVPVATLIPHLYPVGAPGLAPFGFGARPARTRLGAALWRGFDPLVQTGLRLERRRLGDVRARVGLPRQMRLFGGLSPSLVLVGTFPQLEVARRWPEHVHVVGPLLWEPDAPVVDPPAGPGPLVLLATSTAQDPENRLLRAALRGLAREPLRMLGVWNGRALAPPVAVPANVRLVSWLSYRATMGACDLVVCHGGSGTVGRALERGCPVLVVPPAGDMPENGARVAWAGAGRRLPWPLLSPRTLRHAVRGALRDPRLAARARELAAWAQAGDGAARAADLVEALARRGA